MASAWASLQLGSVGTLVEDLEDVRQCVRIILLTPKGTVPHRPDFGCDAWQWLDAPLPVATPRIVAAVVEALETHEPRVAVDRVSVQPGDAPGHLIVTVTLRIRETAQPLSVAVPLAA